MKGIYVPGLGDRQSMGQDKAVAEWKKYGIDFVYHPVHWGDKEAFAPKLDRITNLIDELYDTSGKVVLMGSSAGASAIIHAYAQRKSRVRALVYICGKVHNPGSLGDKDYQINPAFKESLTLLPESLKQLTTKDLDKFLNVHSWYDRRVPVADTRINGVQELVVPMLGHVTSIAITLAFYKKPISEFVLAA